MGSLVEHKRLEDFLADNFEDMFGDKPIKIIKELVYYDKKGKETVGDVDVWVQTKNTNYVFEVKSGFDSKLNFMKATDQLHRQLVFIGYDNSKDLSMWYINGTVPEILGKEVVFRRRTNGLGRHNRK